MENTIKIGEEVFSEKELGLIISFALYMVGGHFFEVIHNIDCVAEILCEKGLVKKIE